ncbi:MAG: hypothetical protein ACFB0B_01630 [Thermonemataceae bacterium]
MKYFLFILTFVISYAQMYGQDLDSLSKVFLKDFKETFETENLEVGEVTIRQEEYAVHFDIEVIPKKEGLHFMKQVFTFEQGYGYRNNSILSIIRAGKKGANRYFDSIEPNLYRGYTCVVGDTILVPVYWNKHVVQSSFYKADEQGREWVKPLSEQQAVEPRGEQLDWEVTNQVEELQVNQVTSGYATHRSLKTQSVYHTMQLKAIKPGAFTLRIKDRTLPVVIYPSEANIRKLLTLAIGKQWSERATSHSSPPGYKKEAQSMLLRVGDIINVTFMMYEEQTDRPVEIDLEVAVNKVN